MASAASQDTGRPSVPRTFNTATLRTKGFSRILEGLGVRLCPGVGFFELKWELRRDVSGNRTMMMVGCWECGVEKKVKHVRPFLADSTIEKNSKKERGRGWKYGQLRVVS